MRSWLVTLHLPFYPHWVTLCVPGVTAMQAVENASTLVNCNSETLRVAPVVSIP